MILQTETQRHGRMPFFDFLKMFAMFMVLWGHAIQHLQTGEVWNEPMHKVIYSFHLPLFMMIAGFFSLSSMNLPFADFVKKKGVQLLLPCLTWGIILYGVIAFMDESLGARISYSPFFVFFQHFWFLKSLFVCYIIAYLGNRLCHSMAWWILLTLAVAHITTTHQIPIMYFCFLGGILLRLYFHKFESNCKAITSLSGLVFVFLLIVTKGDLPLKGINAVDIIKNHSITPPVLAYLNKIIISLSSSIFFIGLALWLNRNSKCADFFAKSKLTTIGKYTLGIYILQSIILETVMAEYIKVGHWGGIFSSLIFDIYIVFPLISFFVLWTCAELTRFIGRSHFLGFWLLGNVRKK